MPFSSDENKVTAVEWLKALRPRTILDVGAGAGTWAKLLRPIVPRSAWIGGVEIWGPYVEKFELESLYDCVAVADVNYLDWDKFDGLDLVIFGDVLEHLDKYDAKHAVYSALKHAGRVLVCIPVEHVEFGAYEGNPFDAHHMANMWTASEFKDIVPQVGGVVVEECIGNVVAYFLIEADNLNSN